MIFHCIIFTLKWCYTFFCELLSPLLKTGYIHFSLEDFIFNYITYFDKKLFQTLIQWCCPLFSLLRGHFLSFAHTLDKRPR